MRRNLLLILLVVLSGIALTAMPIWADNAENNSEPTVQIAPTVGYAAVDGDSQKFREDWWRNDDWFGGVDQFKFQKALPNDLFFSAEGRAIFLEDDYKARFQLEKKDLWFFRVGYSEYRKYFDSTGGVFQPSIAPLFRAGDDLHLNIGNVFVEGGLNAPGLPKVLLGFEHRFKEGEKSLLEWGSVTEAGIQRKLTAAVKNIDETLDIFKAEIEHDICKVHVGNKFQYEHFDTNTRRTEGSVNLDNTTATTINIFDSYKHDAFYNTFHADSHVTDKLFLSMAYFFTTLDGEPALHVINAPPNANRTSDRFTRAVDVSQNAHIASLNATANPFEAFTIYGGFQGSTSYSSGDTDVLLGGLPTSTRALIVSSNDQRGFEENLGVRYTGIPRTTVYAEGRWTQQDIDLFERELRNQALPPNLLRDTDTFVDRQRYSIGFNTSPFNRVTLSARYRHNIYANDYDHRTDNTLNAYSAFITNQEFTTEDFTVKAGLRLTSWLQTSFQYQLVTTDIETDVLTDPPTSTTSGNYNANVYSGDFTLTPLPRLFLTGLFSYTDARTKTVTNGFPGVIPYDGDVFTLMAAAAYGIDDLTKVSVQYLYSFSDNFTDFSRFGLPLGLDNSRHGLTTSFSRRINKNVELKLRYGFFSYREDSNDGVDDYDAHVVSAGCYMRF